MQQQIEQSKQFPPIKLQPLISYPEEAQVGKTYLMTIDVQLEEVDADWPYPEEEYAISFLLDLHPCFSYKALSKNEPTIILHRFGGTYGPAEFLLTASTKEALDKKIHITFLNASGLPMVYFELSCSIRQEVEAKSEQKQVAVITPFTEDLTHSPAFQATSVPSTIPPHIEEIERQLQQAGWTVVEYEAFKSRAWGINAQKTTDPLFIFFAAVKSVPLYPHDYVLLINEEIVGFVKTQLPDDLLTDAAKTITSLSLTRNLNVECKYAIIPFVYEATGSKIQITNKIEINPRCREISMFHRPGNSSKMD